MFYSFGRKGFKVSKGWVEGLSSVSKRVEVFGSGLWLSHRESLESWVLFSIFIQGLFSVCFCERSPFLGIRWSF